MYLHIYTYIYIYVYIHYTYTLYIYIVIEMYNISYLALTTDQWVGPRPWPWKSCMPVSN